ncbi:hypothetical protein N7495_008111 [Penicillium taxi]|uniref:uncharacterized protein n=1 Tax=Penicillium taxi TaxID=168475 RepID=UPI002545A0EA|nr:uncharacterized protein N7495_008111 [Penicillium taxi]KAJ5888070.1 hypothetical protein N7495_008111 [Penicillium taxi]
MIVAGSADIDVSPSNYKQGEPPVTIYALDAIDSKASQYTDIYGIEYASGTDTSGTVCEKGTSFAAPTIAGFSEYLISIDLSLQEVETVAKNVKAKIVELRDIRWWYAFYLEWYGRIRLLDTATVSSRARTKSSISI